MSHSAMSIADSASVKMPAGPAVPAAARSLSAMRSTCVGSSPTMQRAKLVAGGLERAGDGAAEERDADAVDAIRPWRP